MITTKHRDPYATRVVVTGLGAITPIGATVVDFWDSLANGVSGGRRIRNTPLEDFPVQIGAEIDLPDLTDYFPRRMARRLGRFVIFGHIAAAQAFDDAGFTRDGVVDESPRFGAIIGTGEGGAGLHFDTFLRIQDRSMESVSPFYVPGVIPNSPTAWFCKEYGLTGPSYSVNSACASGNHAFGSASMAIRMGLADVMFAGATEALMNIPAFAGLGALGALSEGNGDPARASKPFDRDRDGFVLGEGAGVLCLEELDHARRRGARIYAELTGFGCSTDAHDMVAPHPQGTGAATAMQMALDQAQLGPGDIDLVSAHATSTTIGDAIESLALERVFGPEHSRRVCVHSVKSMTGHSIGASAGIEAVAAIMAIDRGIVHPSINIDVQDPEIPLNVVRETREARVDHVLSNSFGFGGQNAVVALSRLQN